MTGREYDGATIVGVLRVIAQGVEALEAFHDASDELEPQAQADAIALVMDLRQRLGLVENDLATTLGKAEGPIQGNLSDGRQFTLKRSAERKAWNHDDWKRDVRRAVTKAITDDFTDPDATVAVADENGEVWDLKVAALIQEAMLRAQEVHGSTDPRTTSLKRLGLYATDYCESRPGGWRFTAVKPTPPAPDTTTQEN